MAIRSIFSMAVTFLAGSSLYAQIVTADPFFPTQNDAVIISYDATQGNQGLMGFTGDVYAHTGVITSESSSPSDWKHAPSSWGDNSEKYKLTRVGTDLYELAITPSIKEYYGLLANETVQQMAFVFRSEDNSREGKTATGGDIYYDVYEPGLNLRIIQPSQSPLLVDKNDSIAIEAYAIDADSMQLFLNDTLIRSLVGTALIDTLYATQTGKNWIRITASDSENTIADSIYYYIKGTPPENPLPDNVTDGINYINDSTLTLVLFAPGKEYVFVLGDFNDWELDNEYYMNRTPGGERYWITLEELVPGKEYIYQYLVDGEILIADPYCEKVSDPWNDKWIGEDTYPGLILYPEGKTSGVASVFQTAQEEYQWQLTDFQPPAAEELVIYELLVRDFVADHSYQTLIDTLDYLENLGVNAIELMPVNEFEGNLSWGYNPSFYFAPDKYYGTKNDLKEFIDQCHSREIAVIIDMVLNHSFGLSPMVRLYWDASANAPSEESPWFNQVPKHDFNVGYDFNHESEHTRQLTHRVVKFWLEEYNVDGYRFDLSKGFTQKNTLGNTAAWGEYDAGRIALWKSYADTIWNTRPESYVILEHFANNDEEQVLTDYGMMVWGNAVYNYGRAGMGWNYNGKSDFSWGSYQQRSFSKPHLVTYMESHDEQRQMLEIFDWGNYNNPNYNIRENLDLSLIRAELCAAFFFTIPGPKMIWQFGELGYDFSINFNGRTGQKPIRWDYYDNPNRLRLYQAYSALVNLKKDNEAFNSSDYSIDVSDTLKTIHIRHASMDVTVIGNFDISPNEIDPAFTRTGTWYDYFSGDSLVVTDINDPVYLEQSEYRIYTTEKLVSPEIINAPVARDVQVSGTLGLGETLTGEYSYYDRDGDPEGSSTFKWYRGKYEDGALKEEITGATESSYTITDDDWGHYLFFEVRPIAQSGTMLTGIPAYAFLDIATAVSPGTMAQQKIIVYPNPSANGFTFRLKTNYNEILKYRIYNMDGKLIYASGDTPGDGTKTEFRWDGRTSGGEMARPGVYFIRIFTDNAVHSLSLMITQ